MKLGIMMIFGVLLLLTKVLFVNGAFEPCPCNPCGASLEGRSGGVQTCWCYMCSAKKKNPDICSPISIDTVYKKKSGYSFTWEDKKGMTKHSIATVVTSAEPSTYDGVDVTTAKGAVYPKAIDWIYKDRSKGITDAIKLKDMAKVNQPVIDEFVRHLCPDKKAPHIHLCSIQMKCFSHDITKKTKMQVNPLAITHSSTILSHAKKVHNFDYMDYGNYDDDLYDQILWETQNSYKEGYIDGYKEAIRERRRKYSGKRSKRLMRNHYY